MNTYFVSAIDTNVGKTVVSAILSLALDADYWKPVQSGDLDNSDSLKIKELTEGKVVIHPEAFRLNHPLSPHTAAKLDEVSIELSDFQLPETNNNLIIEGAGGLMVPLNEKGNYIADLIQKFNSETFLVIKNYLGSINHTLLSIDYLKRNNIQIKGIIVVGESNQSSEEIIVKNTGVKILHHVPLAQKLSPEFIQEQAYEIRKKLSLNSLV